MFRKVLIITISCLITVIAATGCSSATSVEPTPLPMQPVRLQLQWITQAQFAGYYVALDKGWYEEEGIDLTISPGAPDIIPIDSVTSGAADFATNLLPDLAVAIQDGKQVVSVAQIQQANGLLLISKKFSGIETPQDFAGKKVGVWLGGWDTQFNALMAKEELESSDYELVSQGFSMDSFINGELDVASAMIYNEYHVVLESGIAADELNIIDYADYGLDIPGDALFTSIQNVEDNPDLVLRMVQASLRGWQYAVEHPEEAVDIVLKYDESGVQTREHQLAMMNEIAKLVQVTVRPIGFTDQSDVSRMIDTLASYGILSEEMRIETIYTNDFWEQARSNNN